MGHVFISYAGPEKEIADRVCSTLEEAGIACWMAPRNIPAGTQYAEAIYDAVESCDLFVVVLSGQSNDSAHVLREVELAVSSRVPVLAFRVEDFSLCKAMRYFVGPHHWLDAARGPWEKGLPDLLEAVRRARSNPDDLISPPAGLRPGLTAASSAPQKTGVSSARAGLGLDLGSGPKIIHLWLQNQCSLGRSPTESDLVCWLTPADEDNRRKTMRIGRRHCRIEAGADGVGLMDEGSANGSFVNGRKVEPGETARLEDGARINLARVVDFRFHEFKNQDSGELLCFKLVQAAQEPPEAEHLFIIREAIIGSGPGAAIEIDHPSLKEAQARLISAQGSLYLENLDPDRPVGLYGIELRAGSPLRLDEDGVISLGGLELDFRLL